MHETVAHGELKDLGGVAAVASATSVAVDDHLGIKADRGGRAHIVEDVETIGDGRGGGLSPA